MDKKHWVCPWQAGHMLTGSLRKLLHNPRRIVEPYLSEGMTAMDIGCGMGFFSIPMAEIAGSNGKVIAVDLQPKMLEGLREYADKSGIKNITHHQCGKNSLEIAKWNGSVDFAIIFWMLHEVPDPQRLIDELAPALSENGKILFVEPYIHVNEQNFKQSLDMIKSNGFKVISEPKIPFSRGALLQKS